MTTSAPFVDSKSPLIPAATTRPGDDPIFALNAEARRRAQSGEKIINATLGALMEDDGRLAILPAVSEALARVPPERAAPYAPIAGVKDYLEAVVADLFGDGPLSKLAVAVATPGGTGACHHAIVNFLEPGQALLTTSFYWGPYRTLAEHTGRQVETFPMFGADGRLNTPALEEALHALLERQGRALLVLNTPCHNPTGYSLDEGEWEDVARILRAASAKGTVTLLVDLAYAKFGGPDSDRWVRAVESLVQDVTVLVAWTVSKSFAQYGARVGSLVALHPDDAERERIGNALAFSCRGTWSNCNHLGMLAITDLLETPELARRSETQRGRLRELLTERVKVFNHYASTAGLKYPRYEGGFFVAVFTDRPQEVAARAREKGVFVVPIGGAVRVALCSTPAHDVPELVSAVREAIEAIEAEGGA